MNVSIHIPKQYMKVWERIKKISEDTNRGIGWVVCSNWQEPEDCNDETGN